VYQPNYSSLIMLKEFWDLDRE